METPSRTKRILAIVMGFIFGFWLGGCSSSGDPTIDFEDDSDASKLMRQPVPVVPGSESDSGVTPDVGVPATDTMVATDTTLPGTDTGTTTQPDTGTTPTTDTMPAPDVEPWPLGFVSTPACPNPSDYGVQRVSNVQRINFEKGYTPKCLKVLFLQNVNVLFEGIASIHMPRMGSKSFPTGWLNDTGQGTIRMPGIYDYYCITHGKSDGTGEAGTIWIVAKD